MNLEVRSEVIEYGALPTAPWLAGVDSLQQLRSVILQLLQAASFEEGRCEWRAIAGLQGRLPRDPWL